jgi:hypothetical protein
MNTVPYYTEDDIIKKEMKETLRYIFNQVSGKLSANESLLIQKKIKNIFKMLQEDI